MPSIVLRRRKENVFFSSIAILLIGYVLLGFWPSYFAQGMFLAPLPSLLVQVHAFVFLGWIILFSTQIVLIGRGRSAVHRRLGQVMIWWAGAIAIVGPATTIMAVRRGAVGPGPFAGDLAQSLVFVILITTGFARRQNAPEHKRLMMLATATIVGPAIVRWPFDFILHEPPFGILFFYLLPPLLLVTYDLSSMRRIHRATWFGLGLMVLVLISFVALPSWSVWQAITASIRQV